MSSKKNPLFQDSTRPVGDKVVTKVELSALNLQDGESVFIEILDQYGFEQRFSLRRSEKSEVEIYLAEVWLKYQHQIQYRFLLIIDEVIKAASEYRETRAGHVISEKWQACSDPNATRPKMSPSLSRRAEFVNEMKQRRDNKSATPKGLGEPEYLEQIKALIKELL